MARILSSRGFGGFEWAAGIPGTVGGAIYGNAGAHSKDVAGCLIMAEILHRDLGKVDLLPEEMSISYRSSAIKRCEIDGIILSAKFRVERSSIDTTKRLIEEFSQYRRRTQPSGASLGSMFKNPPGDFAGRLIEQAGLKGTRIGGAVISPVHANFFITDVDTSADDIYALIQRVREVVHKKFGVLLELEIELIGDWGNHDG
jgi:UDP-N-acetylmuramate dehydrogenase